jgi:hypothetical protein
MELVCIPKSEVTPKFLENIYQSIFDEKLPASYFRYDLCLAVKNTEGNLVSFALVRELTSDSVELAWGGTSKDYRGFSSLKNLNLYTEECFKHYQNVSYQTWNKNHKMLKLGLGLGFDVVGCRQSGDGHIFLILNKKRG